MSTQRQIALVCTFILAGLMAVVATSAQTVGPNIVIFIGDGMGFEHVQAGRLYRHGTDATPLTFETLEYRGQAVTKLPNGTITDSATAGTALATGYQHPANGIISMGANYSIKTTILELAKAKGLRTGIITTDSISGATPGAFGAHEPDRTLEADIRLDYLLDDTTYPHAASRPNVLFGGGFNDPYVIPGPNKTYVAIANSLGYLFVNSASSLTQIGTTDYALGLFCSSWAPMATFMASSITQPRLPQMVSKALDLLQNNGGAGLFLMVEGALIDKLSHSNDRNFTPEVAQLDLAVEQAFAWANENAQSLLVIVTADHETGGVNVPDGQSITPGTIPNLSFSGTGHTEANVPVFATWPAGLQGQTIDNTEVFYVMEDYLEGMAGKPPQVSGLAVTGITETEATVQWTTIEPSDSQVLLSGVTQPFANTVRVTAHALLCTGLTPATTYTVTASSTDLAGFTGTADTTFTTLAPSFDAVVKANPVVAPGTLAGSFTGVNALNDGITQTITEAAHGSGSGLQVEYTLHTAARLSEIGTLILHGAVSWTLKDGASDSLVTEVRVLAPGGAYGWERINLDAPFLAEPPQSYVDAGGNVIVRFTDTASIKRERKDTLAVDYLVGEIGLNGTPVPDVTSPSILSATAASSASIVLAWTDAANETGYDIWRYTVSGGWVVAGSANANTTTYTDTGLEPSTVYAYVVRAHNNQSYADSTSTAATTDMAELEMPENLAAKSVKGAVNLTWTDTNTGESGYEVLRSEMGGGAASLLAKVGENLTKYTDNAVVKGVTYQYQVRAVRGETLGPLSGPVMVTVR